MTTDAPTDAIDVYWRPGCPYCALLLRKLRRRRIPMRLHNIWEDDGAAAAVRAVANGNETVPTVMVGGRSLVNPGVGALAALLAEVAPHLLPVTRRGGRFGRPARPR